MTWMIPLTTRRPSTRGTPRGWTPECGSEFVSCITDIGDDVTQPKKAMADGPKVVRCAVAVLDPCRMN